jgi:SCO1/SenC family protein
MSKRGLDAQEAARTIDGTGSRCFRVSTALALTGMLIGALVPAWAEEASNPSATALIEALLENREPIGGSFKLIDQAGRRRTDADFRGKVVLIYFGYTNAVAIATRGAVDFRASGMLMPKSDAQAWSFARTARVAGACERSSPKLWFRLSVVIGWQR